MSLSTYSKDGRSKQKAKTENRLLDELRRALAAGVAVTVESVAERAGISRATAYRYFPTKEDLLIAAYPEITATSLLGADPPADLEARVDLVLYEQLRIVREWEPQLRAALAGSLIPGSSADRTLRGGRAIDWIEEALEPLRAEMSKARVHRLAIRIRAVAGIESYVWLIDVAGVRPADATRMIRENARAVLASRNLR